jgi:serine/threonine-protein kinase
VERALAKDANDRFPDGGAFAEAVRRVAAGGTLVPVAAAGPPTTPTQVVGGLADSRTQVIAATGATAVAGAGLAGPATGPAGPMPPLQAPPEDDDWGPEAKPPDDRRRGRSRWVWLAAAVVLLLVLGGGAWWLLGDGDPGQNDASGSPTTSSAATTPPAGGVLLDPGALVGRPADDVEAELESAGLEVTQETAAEDQLAGAGQPLDAGDVAALDPSGETVPPQTEVTLYVADASYPPAEVDETEEEPSTPPTSEAPRETTAPTTPTSVPETSTPPTSAATTTDTLGGTDEPPPPPSEPPPPQTEGEGGAVGESEAP